MVSGYRGFEFRILGSHARTLTIVPPPPHGGKIYKDPPKFSYCHLGKRVHMIQIHLGNVCTHMKARILMIIVIAEEERRIEARPHNSIQTSQVGATIKASIPCLLFKTLSNTNNGNCATTTTFTIGRKNSQRSVCLNTIC